jgi:integrase
MDRRERTGAAFAAGGAVEALQYSQRGMPAVIMLPRRTVRLDFTLSIASFTSSIASVRSCLVTSSFMMKSRAASAWASACGAGTPEGLNLLASDTRPEERAAWLRTSKNEDPRMLHLRLDLVGPLFDHLKNHSGERLFRFNDGGRFKHLLLRAKLAVCGLPCPKRRPTGWKPPAYRLSFDGFHTFRHTWATWMRRYGGADVQGLVETKNWRDPRSAQRYAHVVEREEWRRVDKLPSMGNIRGKAANE